MNRMEFTLHLLEDTRKHTLAQVEDLTDQEMMFQPKPEVNHALWLLGHIATSENGLILRWCANESALPGEYVKVFFMGTTPQSDPSLYPTKDEILDVLTGLHARAIEVVEGLSAEALDERPIGYEEMNPRAQELFWSKGACIYVHATHEAGHASQITLLRRLLGKPYRV